MAPHESERPHAAIICNPVKVQVDDVRRVVEAAEERHGWGPSQWFETRSEDAGRGAAEAALAGGPSVVLVAGGDGGVRVAAETFLESGTPIALLPSGTGNLLARNLGLPIGDIERCVEIAFGRATRQIDVGIADLEDEHGARNRRMFLVMAGIGLDAEMAERTSALAKRHLGWLAYVAPIARSIVRNRLFHVRYRVDGGRTRSAHAHTIIVGNCGTLTGDMLLLPAALVDDGLLDVIMLRPRGRFEWARIGTRLTLQGLARRSRLTRRLLRRVPELRSLAYAQGRRFDVRFETPHGAELDGDSFGPIIGARIAVRAAAIRICVEAHPAP